MKDKKQLMKYKKEEELEIEVLTQEEYVEIQMNAHLSRLDELQASILEKLGIKID